MSFLKISLQYRKTPNVLVLIIVLLVVLNFNALAQRNITISTSATSGGTWSGADPDVFTPNADNANILNTEIQTRLATKGVSITTTGGGSQAGDVTISTTITAAPTVTGKAFTVTSAGTITINTSSAINLTPATSSSTISGCGITFTAGTGISISSAITATGGISNTNWVNGGAGGVINLSTTTGSVTTSAAGTITSSGATCPYGTSGAGGAFTCSGASVSLGASVVVTGGGPGSGQTIGGVGGAVSITATSTNLVASDINTTGGSANSVGTGAVGGAVTLTANTGNISAGAITTNGGVGYNNNAGGAGGAVTIADHTGTTTITTITALGGASGNAIGTAGGVININATTPTGGDVSIGNINNSGASPTGNNYAGGAGGGITIKTSTGSISCTGTVTSKGATGLYGAGGVGGALTIVSSTNVTISGTIDVSGGGVTGNANGSIGGAINITATSGTVSTAALTTTGGTVSSSGAGGAGGAISITAANATSISVGAVTTTGGAAAGSFSGGAAGNFTIADHVGTTTITSITANGGTCGGGNGAAGGAISINATTPTGGNVTIGAIANSGSSPNTNTFTGGNGGNTTIKTSSGTVNCTSTITSTGGAGNWATGGTGGSLTIAASSNITLGGTVNLSGGTQAGQNTAGAGGPISLTSTAGNVSTVALTTSGGASSSNGAGGAGGNITITANAATTVGIGAITTSGGVSTGNYFHGPNGGSLSISATAAAFTSTSAITTNGGNGPTYQSNGGTGGAVTIAASTISITGGVTISTIGGTPYSGYTSVGGAVTLTGTAGLTLAAGITATGTTTNGALAINDGNATVTSSGTNDGQITSGVFAGGNFTKTGSGNLYLSRTNTYTGNTILSAGMVRVAGALATSTSGNFGNNANPIQLNGGGIEFNSTCTRALSVTANGSRIDAYGSARTVSAAISATGAYSLTVGGTTVASSEGQDLTLSGAITNGTGTLSLIKNYSSQVILSSTSNAYSGGTTITAGTLTLGAAGVLADAGAINLNGGTFKTGATTGYAETVGVLTLSNNSTIALGTGSHTLTFASSSGASWTAGKKVIVTGWTTAGSWGSGTGNAGKIVVTSSGLSAGQLAQICFYDGSSYWTAKFSGTEVIPDVVCGTVALSSATPSVAASSIAQSATKKPLSRIVVTVTGASATLNQLVFTSAGTYVAADMAKFQLWYNTADDLSTATQVAGSDITTSMGTGVHTFASLSQVISVGSCYLWITADVSGSATVANTISASAIASTDLTLASVCGSVSGSVSAGGSMDIIALGLASPALTAAAGATVDAAFDVTFVDDATWRAAITSITIDGTPLTSGYSVTAGIITFTPSASAPAGLLQTAGVGKNIVVIATGYTNDNVSQTILAGVATKLAMSVQPTDPASNGAVLATQPVVLLQDQYSNLTTSTENVVASVGAGAWTIGGTTTKAGVSGTATFTDLTATSLGPVSGATITFTSAGLTSVTSNGFNIIAPTPPTLTAAAGATVDAAFDMTFPDNATWRAAITSITVGGVTLTSGYTVAAGKITFTPSASGPAGLLQTAGINKAIVVNATGFNADNGTQTILAGTATKLGIGTQPSATTTSGSVIGTQPVVLIQDQYGNTTTSTATVTATVGAGGWTISGTTAKAGVSGTATYTDLIATNATSVTGATFIFTSPGLTSVTSNTFNIVLYSCASSCTVLSGATVTALANTEYCLPSGSWSGDITVSQTNVRICIGGTWTPSSGIAFNNTNCILDNAGSITAPSIALNFSGCSIINGALGYMNMNGTANASALNSGTIFNNSGTYISNGFATISATTVVNNAGGVIVDTSTSDLYFASTCASFANNGTIRKNGGDIMINMVDNTLTNNGLIWNHKNGNFTVNSANFTNSGTLIYQGITTLTSTGAASNGNIANTATGIWRNNYTGATADVVVLNNLVDFTNAGTFYNNKGNLILYNGVTLVNSAATANLTVNNGNLIFTNTASITNAGNINITGTGGISSPCNNASFTNNGRVTIENGDMDWDNNGNVFNNNGVLTLQGAGKSIILGNAGYSTLNNNGKVIAPNMYVGYAILQNNCLVQLSGDFTLNDGHTVEGVRGPSTASGYVGRISVAGTTSWQAGSVFGQAGQSIDFCDAGMPAGGWDSNTSGYTESGTVTHCTASADGDAGCDLVLPISLLYFVGMCNGDYTTTLQWATSSEINNEKFNIEHSVDGKTFETIANVNGAGNSNKRIDYKLTDNDSQFGVNYYRLSQVDYDGKKEIYPMYAVTCESELSKTQLTLHQNPIENKIVNFSISDIESQFVNIEIIDNLGRSIYSAKKEIETNQLVSIKLNNYFANGMYVIRVSSPYFNLVEKLIVK